MHRHRKPGRWPTGDVHERQDGGGDRRNVRHRRGRGRWLSHRWARGSLSSRAMRSGPRRLSTSWRRRRPGLATACIWPTFPAWRRRAAWARRSLERAAHRRARSTTPARCSLERRVTAEGLETDLRAQPHGLFRADRGARANGSSPPRRRASSRLRRWRIRARASISPTCRARKGYNGWRAYGRSKLANILFTRELARRLAGTGVTANCLHPGFVASRFGDGIGRLDKPPHAARPRVRDHPQAGRRHARPSRLVVARSQV